MMPHQYHASALAAIAGVLALDSLPSVGSTSGRRPNRDADPKGARGLRRAAAPVKVNVGRNEACPCRSGKKFKKCCIDKPIVTSTPALPPLRVTGVDPGDPGGDRTRVLVVEQGSVREATPDDLQRIAAGEGTPLSPDEAEEALILLGNPSVPPPRGTTYTDERPADQPGRALPEADAGRAGQGEDLHPLPPLQGDAVPPEGAEDQGGG